MNQDTILQQVLSSDELPTLPTVASKLITLTAQEDTTLSDIADLVSKDISLSSKILKVSNSAFYSFPQQIGSIKQAVSILGTNAVRSLVLSFSFLSIKKGRNGGHFDFIKFWERSLASAVASKLILEHVKDANTEEIFISGLLQNLGELIFARTFPKKYDEVLQAINEDQHDNMGAEKNFIGVDHCFVGYEVAKNWGFPDKLLLPILYHHDPLHYKGKNKEIEQTTYAVYLSDLITSILYSNKPEEYHKQFIKEARRLLKLKEDDISIILDGVHTQVEEAGEYFGLKIKNSKSIQEILQEANVRLGVMNLDYEQMNKKLIKTTIELENLTKELEEKNRKLDNLANIDGLTNVYNHRYFQNSLDQEISRASRNESQISLLYADIDFFKKFNDTYGHQTGDFILIEFCRVLTENLRKYDLLARYGGEEFVVILPETSIEEAETVGEKLRAAIEEKVFDDGREEYKVTASFGISTCKPSDYQELDKSEFIKEADTALYEAKKDGRNRIAVYKEKKKWFNL